MGSQGVQDILKFLVQGDQMIRFSSSREIILVLGLTGTGKTTLTHFIALNNDGMVSEAKGKGDYIIKDNTKKICDSTINSCTVIPELVIDQKVNNTAYYDCPGFSDTRNVSHDIGATYFIQKVIRRMGSVKIIFAVSYDSVRQGGDRHAFMNLARHIHSMFTNIAKFENSVCLVVTKVENIMEEEEDGSYKLVPDDVMIQNVVAFLMEVRDDLEARIKTEPPQGDKQFYENTGTLINILTNDKEQKTAKIGIFRRPNKKGRLSKLQALQRGRVALRKMIYQQLGYTLCDHKDFGYTISDTSKDRLKDLRDGINENITQNISKIGRQLIEKYNNQEKTADSIDDLVDRITVACNKLSHLSSVNDDKAREFIKKIIATVNELKVEISTEVVQKTDNFCGYLEFIKSLMRQTTIQPVHWGYGLEDVVSYLRESKEWYLLMIELRTTLSEYTIQQDIKRYNYMRKKLVSDIANHNQEKNVVTSLKQFLSKVNEDSGRMFVVPSMGKLDEIKLRFLEELMEVAFAQINYECKGSKLVVKGSIIRMKDAENSTCYGQAQVVEIFGSSKVFLDVNVNKPQGLLRIFTPELEVMNEPTLVFDGVRGVDYTPAKATTTTKDPGSKGASGQPGNPGGSAGVFVGIGQVCINCNKLSVSAVGAEGGKGQNGGDGVAGRDGNRPFMIQHTCDNDVWKREWRDGGFDDVKWKSYSETYRCRGNIFGQFCEHQYRTDYTVLGKAGSQGGKGGDGGRGGIGGNTGKVYFLFDRTRGSTEVVLKNTTSNGQVGVGGSGGQGGHGGKQGDTLYQSTAYRENGWWVFVGDDKCLEMRYEGINKWGATGEEGEANKNTADLKHPNIVNFNPSRSINQYKNFLRKNMGNCINNSILRNFLEYIETDSKINSFYNTIDFVDDLIVMESQIYGQPMSFLNARTYKNFMGRITRYAQNLKGKGMSDGNKLVLGYLYTSILTKIIRAQRSSSIELVIDIKGYLKSVKEDIKQLQEFNIAVERNKSKAKYQESLMGKINEAKVLISRDISLEIDYAIQQLRDDVQSLLEETIALEEEAEANEIKLSDYRNKLEAQMGSSVVLGILRGIGQALGFLHPVGAQIGSLIGSASMVIADLATVNTGSPEIPDLISKLPDGVNKCLEALKEAYKKKQGLYLSQLTKASQMLTEFNHVSIIAGLRKEINKKQEELEEALEKAVNGDRKALQKYYQAKIDLSASLKEAMELLEKQKEPQNTKKSKDLNMQLIKKTLKRSNNQKETLNTEKSKDFNKSTNKTLKSLSKQKETPEIDESKIDRCIDIVSKIQNAVDMAAIGVDIHGKVMEAKSSIRTLNEAIKRNEEYIAKLKKYEEAIYSTILPMAEGIKNEIDNAARTSAGKSHAALDVSSWRVQTKIRQVKIQLKDMIVGFKSQGKIMNTIDRVMYGMTTVIQVYDRIQDYYDQAELADYISDITSDKAKSIKIHVSDISLQEAIDKLAFELQKNIVLAEYERSMSAVRQYVFPFGNYVDEYNLPNELRVANTSHTIAEVIYNIATVLARLEKDVTVIKSGDQNIYPKQEFSSQGNRNPPFYVWKHTSNKYLLRQLFQGNEVMMHADIAKGIQENAMKFDRIGVYFRAKCCQLQNELNEALDGFSIKMTLLGNSYYKCGPIVFTMTHGHIAIKHSVTKKDGDYFNQNEVYEKITNNEPLLSPYGIWKMQLIGQDFNTLAQYIGQSVDIELEGRAKYLNHEEDEYICNDGLKQYYEEVTDSAIYIVDDSNGVVDDDDMEVCETTPSLSNSHIKIKNAINRSLKLLNLNTSETNPGEIIVPTIANHNNISIGSPSNSQSEAIPHLHMAGENAQNASAIQPVNYSLLNVQGNLLLMNMLIRRVNKRAPSQVDKMNPKDEEYAHRMAYSAHAPRN